MGILIGVQFLLSPFLQRFTRRYEKLNKVYQREDHQYFEKTADEVACWLLGKVFCRRISENRILRFRITETEAYGDIGDHVDSACHANKYKTGNAVITQRMSGGTIYVHNNYKHSGSSFDIVAGKSGEVQSVLIRGAVDLDTGKKYNKIIILGEALHIDYKTLNQSYLLDSNELWLEVMDLIRRGKSVSQSHGSAWRGLT